MSYFWTCPYCEANLDHGERCETCGCNELDDMNRKHHKHLKKSIRNMEDIKDELIRD